MMLNFAYFLALEKALESWQFELFNSRKKNVQESKQLCKFWSKVKKCKNFKLETNKLPGKQTKSNFFSKIENFNQEISP